MYVTTLPSPLGSLTLSSDGQAITGLWFENQKHFAAGLADDALDAPELPVFRQAAAWLYAYFSRKPFPSLPPLNPQGTKFRTAVWNLLLEIPYGETVTYGTLTARLKKAGLSGSARAVGGAVGHNPISILIPCHRVVGANGRLTGYAGGIERKEFLLCLESKEES